MENFFMLGISIFYVLIYPISLNTILQMKNGGTETSRDASLPAELQGSNSHI